MATFIAAGAGSCNAAWLLVDPVFGLADVAGRKLLFGGWQASLASEEVSVALEATIDRFATALLVGDLVAALLVAQDLSTVHSSHNQEQNEN